jgi:hypothetical protein
MLIFRNILSQRPTSHNIYSRTQRVELDEPRSRSNQCIETEAYTIRLSSLRKETMMTMSRDQIDTRYFFFL